MRADWIKQSVLHFIVVQKKSVPVIVPAPGKSPKLMIVRENSLSAIIRSLRTLKFANQDQQYRMCNSLSRAKPLISCDQSTAWQCRYDNILSRLAQAAKIEDGVTMSLNKQLTDVLTFLRPDLVWRNERSKRIIFIDVCVAFQWSSEALETKVPQILVRQPNPNNFWKEIFIWIV